MCAFQACKRYAFPYHPYIDTYYALILCTIGIMSLVLSVSEKLCLVVVISHPLICHLCGKTNHAHNRINRYTIFMLYISEDCDRAELPFERALWLSYHDFEIILNSCSENPISHHRPLIKCERSCVHACVCESKPTESRLPDFFSLSFVSYF